MLASSASAVGCRRTGAIGNLFHRRILPRSISASVALRLRMQLSLTISLMETHVHVTFFVVDVDVPSTRASPVAQ